MNPKISIIVPVYNVEQILRYCVDSICKQSFSDFEILLIDDGSKDNSGKICDELSTFDSRIKVFHKQNGGLSDARNFGIDKSVGDFLLFIDSDDVLHKDFCKILIELQSKYNAEIVSTDLVEFYNFSEINVLNNKDYISTEYLYTREEALNEYYKPVTSRKLHHGLCMKIYKKELFDNLRFEIGRLHEDLYITYKLIDLCNNLVYIDLPYYYYYQKNTNSITKNYREKNLVDEYDALKIMLTYFQNRESIKNSFYWFLCEHFCYLYGRSFDLTKTEVVRSKQKQLKKDMNIFIFNSKYISRSMKIKSFIKIYFQYFYRFYLSIRKGL